MRAFVTALVFVVVCTGADDADAQKARKSPHKRLDRACEACHVATSFTDIRFDHDQTGFPLEGHHSVARCLACHNVEDFSLVDRSCASCHRDVHRGRSGGECERCHNAGGWRVFDAEAIHAGTDFPVMGRHLNVDCETCHPGMPEADFRNTSADCIACHRADYEGVVSPNHAASGFSTECRECHQVTAWKPAVMSDHDAIFPIFSGVHRNQWSDCTDCHTAGDNYPVFDCLGCHEHAQVETDGHHAGMPGYDYNSQACLSCHPTGAAARFTEHDASFFPIYSGRHVGVWTDCSSCHTTGTAAFSCTDCHQHDSQTDTDSHHGGMPGYTYTPTSCFDCHPTGEAGQLTEHDAAYFPIYSGTHVSAWTDCASCHTTGTSAFSCTDCHQHAQADTDPIHAGMTGYAWTPTSCFDCHPTGEGGRFTEHDAAYFPIYTGKHANRWDTCADCHEVATDKSQFTCFNCHSQSRMDDKHLGEVSGYVYDNQACLRCHPDGRSGD